MIVAQISDTHIALDTPDADRRIDDFERTIADINALDPQPDVIVHTGDVAHNGLPAEYALATATLAKARAPAFVMVGNKDDRANLRAAFGLPGASFVAYAVEDFPVRLILLDTLDPDSNKGDFCADRARGFTEMTDAETTKPVAVFAHHPPFEVQVGPEPFNFKTPEAMARIRETVQHSGRVVAVFCGHVHRAAAGHVDGIPASVVPPVATTLRWGDYSNCMKTRPVYFVHRFDPIWGFSTETKIVRNHPSA